MSPSTKPGRAALLGAAIAACAVVAPRSSAADDTPSLALEPAPAGDRGFAVPRAAVRGHLLFSARLATDYAREPLVLDNAVGAAHVVVAYQTWLHALVSFSIAHRLALHVDLPFVMSQGGEPAPRSGGTAPRPGSGVTLGDARVGARLALFGSPDDADVRTDLALATTLWLPTAGDGYAGDGAVRGGLTVNLEGMSRRLYWAFDAGARTRPSAALPGVLPGRVGTALTLGGAGGFFVDTRRQLALGTEMVADLPFAGGASLLDPRATAAHLLVTGQYRHEGGPFEIGAAFGPGFGDGAGGADYRVLVVVGLVSEAAAPPPDEDADGIPDKVDACVAAVGVEARDPLLHGCPEAPADRDGDAIPDVHDACPDEAGEATSARKTHGCPRKVDTDGDTVLDPDDACPRLAGVAPPDGDGCPEARNARIVAEEIVLSQRVEFETGTAVLRPESDAVLGEVASVLIGHPELERVEVQGHTDETGAPERNRALGEERASRVAAWLVAHGVSAGRLVAKGHGSDRPVADNTTEEGRQKNRRVELHVLQRRPAAPPAGGAP